MKSDPQKTKAWQERSARKYAENQKAKGVQNSLRPSGELQRRVPMQTSDNQLRRNAIKPISDRKKKRDSEYSEVNKAYLERHPLCHHCLELGRIGKAVKNATEVHHTAGKEGDLLCDTRLFMAVASECHTIAPDSIHEIGEEARERGWLISRHLSRENQLEVLKELRGKFPWVQKELKA